MPVAVALKKTMSYRTKGNFLSVGLRGPRIASKEPQKASEGLKGSRAQTEPQGLKGSNRASGSLWDPQGASEGHYQVLKEYDG